MKPFEKLTWVRVLLILFLSVSLKWPVYLIRRVTADLVMSGNYCEIKLHYVYRAYLAGRSRLSEAGSDQSILS